MAGNPRDLSVAWANAGAAYLNQGRYTDAEDALQNTFIKASNT